jgi:uncharacterized protein
LKYVIDTNVIVAAVSRRSEHHWIWQSLIDAEFVLCVTTEILAEYEEILSEFYNPAFASFILQTIMEFSNLELVTNYYAWQLIVVDPDDNKFVDCAIACNARCIVSDDKHFKVLKDIPFPKVEVLKPKAFKLFLKK